MTDKLTKAKDKIRARLESIDAALADLAVLVHTHPTGGALSKMDIDIHRNRLASLILGIYHLKDDAKGLARLKGLDKKAVDDFVASCPAVSMCVKAGDTYKHGVGGRGGNSMVMGYEIHFMKRKGDKPSIDDPLVGLAMLIVDEKGVPHQSDVLAKEALHDWLPFLRGLGVDVSEREKKWQLHSLPEGMSVYKGDLPPAFLKHLKEEAKKRKQ